jgi:glycerol uptake facilitator protein
MIVAEFLGAAMLTTVVLAVSKSGLGFALFVSAAAGLTLGLTALSIGGASGAHYNPAVTLGLWSIRKVQTLQAIVYVVAQFFGGFVAWRLFEYLTNQTLPSIASKTFDWRVLVAEAIGAFVLTMGVTSAVVQGYRGMRFATTVGGALFIGALVAGVASNGLLNPAVALGVRSWSTAYVAGPLLGAVLGANLYLWLLAPGEVRPRLVRAKASKAEAVKPVAKAKSSAKAKKPAKRK